MSRNRSQSTSIMKFFEELMKEESMEKTRKGRQSETRYEVRESGHPRTQDVRTENIVRDFAEMLKAQWYENAPPMLYKALEALVAEVIRTQKEEFLALLDREERAQERLENVGIQLYNMFSEDLNVRGRIFTKTKAFYQALEAGLLVTKAAAGREEKIFDKRFQQLISGQIDLSRFITGISQVLLAASGNTEALEKLSRSSVCPLLDLIKNLSLPSTNHREALDEPEDDNR